MLPVAGPLRHHRHRTRRLRRPDGRTPRRCSAGWRLGTARTAATQSTLPEYPGDIAAGDAHVLALAERFAHYTTAMRDAITHAADVGDADTAAVYTDISRGVDKRLQAWKRISTSERDGAARAPNGTHPRVTILEGQHTSLT